MTVKLHASLTPTGYNKSPRNRDEYIQQVQTAQDASNGSAWALGDLYNYGEQHFSDIAEQPFDETKKSLRTIQNYASVCRKFAHARRRASLSFSHHDAVKGLPEAEQDTLLNKAEKDQLSREQLRDLVRGEKEKETVTTCTILSIADVLTENGFDPTDTVEVTVKGKRIKVKVLEQESDTEKIITLEQAEVIAA